MFDALHRRHKASDAMLYAFDLLEFDGEDLRPLVRKCRRKKLALETALLQRMGQPPIVAAAYWVLRSQPASSMKSNLIGFRYGPD
jgi:hypothetical protein